MILFWFRRDLRETDNAGLFHALSDTKEVIPAFVFDKHILDKLRKNDARLAFIHSRIKQLDAIFQKKEAAF